MEFVTVLKDAVNFNLITSPLCNEVEIAKLFHPAPDSRYKVRPLATVLVNLGSPRVANLMLSFVRERKTAESMSKRLMLADRNPEIQK